MSERHPQNNHHALASGHHEDAAHYHREASRHFEIGKDYAHAAHLALNAHGHSLMAIDHGDAALKRYTKAHPEITLPEPSAEVERATATAVPKTLATQHDAAAAHHPCGDDPCAKRGGERQCDPPSLL